MYPSIVSDKRSLNLLILEILRMHTDSKHRLRQEEIIRLLEINYGVKCDRRSVKNNIVSLVQLGYSIPLKGGYCLLEREFEEDELRALIHSVLMSRSIPKVQKGRLIKKLQDMGSRFFQPKVRHIAGIEEQRVINVQRLRENLDRLDDAISQKRQVSFLPCSYDKYGAIRAMEDTPITVNPYQILAANENYYLVANRKDTDSISLYPISLLANVEPLEEKSRLRNELGETAKEYRIPKNLAESIAPEESMEVEAKLRIKQEKVGLIFDWFGRDVRISCTEDGTIDISLRCKEDALMRWAMQYGDLAEVLKPESLREKICGAAQSIASLYHRKKSDEKKEVL